jgi:peptidoglycan/xylan/chitin deacetylase (PgdA/CDA1 family)
MPELHVVMYHYVRDLPRTRYPRIKGMSIDEFRTQVLELWEEFEMPSLEAALAYMRGEYEPERDLCLLTFDDGLKEHFTDVMPILADLGIQGLFGIVTSCVADHIVAPVHMNHFLTAELEFSEYRSALESEIRGIAPQALEQAGVDADEAQRTYPLDTRDMASFKMLVNYKLPAPVRDLAIGSVFQRYFGSEQAFARELYMTWGEVCELQKAGMLISGHTHWHRPLSTLSDTELEFDISTSRGLMDARLRPQGLWPFSYPYGKRNSYSQAAIRALQRHGFDCAFGTEAGSNQSSTPLFELRRTDCKNATVELSQAASGSPK